MSTGNRIYPRRQRYWGRHGWSEELSKLAGDRRAYSPKEVEYTGSPETIEVPDGATGYISRSGEYMWTYRSRPPRKRLIDP
jgi:hypothetical protein